MKEKLEKMIRNNNNASIFILIDVLQKAKASINHFIP